MKVVERTLNQLSQLIPSNDFLKLIYLKLPIVNIQKMTFVVRLQLSRGRRTKLPCAVTAIVAIDSAYLCSLIVFKLQKVPKMFFRSSFNATKSHATFSSMAYFVT